MGHSPVRPTRRAVLTAAVLLALASCAPERSRDSADLRRWRGDFDEAARQESDRIQELSLSRDSSDHYFLAYPLDAYTMMFEATGDPDYLDTAMGLAENVVASARPARTLAPSRFRDDYLSWVSENDPPTGEQPLDQSYLWRYVARMLRVLADHAELFGQPSWRARYERLLAFTERDIVDKWIARGADEHIYRDRTHMAAHWAFIGMEVALLTRDERRRAACRRIKDAIDLRLPNHPSSLRGQLRVDPAEADAYGWSEVWGNGPRDVAQDVAHGNNVIAYVVEAHDLDQGWSAEDIARFSRTLDRVVWPAGGDEATYDVAGDGTSDGWFSDGFVKLGRYDGALQTRLRGHGRRDLQYVAAMALNAVILTTS